MKRPYKIIYIQNSLNTLQNSVIQLYSIKEDINKVYESDSTIINGVDDLITSIKSNIDMLNKELDTLR